MHVSKFSHARASVFWNYVYKYRKNDEDEKDTDKSEDESEENETDINELQNRYKFYPALGKDFLTSTRYRKIISSFNVRKS